MRRCLLPPAGPVLVVLAGLALSTGCGSGPKTHSVKGKVVFEGGDVSKLAGGVVEFQSVSQPETFARGEIQEDGSFSMFTRTEGGKEKAGAVPGDHQARIYLPGSEDEETRLVIDRRYTTFERSGLKVTVPPPEGEVTLKVSRSR